MEEQKKGNSYEVQLQKKGNGTDEVMQYSCMEEQKKETVMKQKQKKGNGTDEVMQYSCMEEQRKRNSYEIEVEEEKWNKRSYLVLLYGGTEEEKQL